MTFHLFEWAIFLCFAFAVKWQDLSLHRNREEIKTIFLIALVLFFLPMLTSRLWNDWALRGSMPALFLLSVVWLENVDVIMTNPRNYLVKLLAIVLVLLGAGNACLEIQRAWPAMQALRYMNYPQKDLSEWFGKDKDYGPQYFSPIQGPFEKYFMKK